MGYDLTLMEKPGALRRRERAETVARALSGVPGLGACEVRSVYSDPDEMDCEDLADLIEEEPESAEHFEAYCKARGLNPAAVQEDASLAAGFLDHQWGVSLATATLPQHRAEAADVYKSIVGFARQYGLRLWDPQSDAEIDLAAPGELPAMWG